MDTISEQYKISAASCIDQVLNPHSTQFNKLECLITTQRIRKYSRSPISIFGWHEG